MNTQIMAVVAACWLVVGGGPEEEAVKKEMQALQGAWNFASLLVDGGDKLAETPLKDAIMTIKDDQMSVKGGGDDSPASRYRLLPTITPKGIDITLGKQNDAGEAQTLEGIYELDGDDFKICLFTPTSGQKERPTEFVSKGETQIVVVFKRMKTN